VHCDAPGTYDASLNATVLFLHGFLGSSNDGAWVRRDAAFRAAGVRYCSLDRPGYGWSENYAMGPHGGPDAAASHFGRVAEMTAAALAAHGVRGRAVLLFHSLGAFHALALAALLRERALAGEGGGGLEVMSAVAVDAVTPLWSKWNVQTTDLATLCDVGAAVVPTHWFWTTMRLLRPSGIPRLALAAGFGGFDALIGMYPPDIGPAARAYSMRRKFFDAVSTELSLWRVNCGHARRGEAAFAALRSLETIVVPAGLNLTVFAELNANSRLTVAGCAAAVDEHVGVMVQKDCAAAIVVPALLRAIAAALA